MNDTLFIALAPVFIIATYIYYRDRWEKEPIGLLLLSLLLGAIVSIPVVFIEHRLMQRPVFELDSLLFSATYEGFVVAAATEELFKFLVFMLVIWNNRNFNEKFDGIVYAVFISLGFAGIENVLYVFSYGVEIGYMRAFTAVPLHALVAVVMGYHLGLAKMGTNRRNGHLLLALVLPILFHGFYDWILMIRQSWYLLLYVPFLYFLWHRAFRRIKTLSEESRFNPKNTWKLPDDFFKKN